MTKCQIVHLDGRGVRCVFTALGERRAAATAAMLNYIQPQSAGKGYDSLATNQGGWASRDCLAGDKGRCANIEGMTRRETTTRSPDPLTVVTHRYALSAPGNQPSRVARAMRV